MPKRILIPCILLGILLAIGGYIAHLFHKSFEFAQNQQAIGTAYMESMEQKDFDEALGFAIPLFGTIKSGDHELTYNNTSGQPVPEPWHSRGITHIRTTTDSVYFCWHGGPFAHTNLKVHKADDGTITFTAHYSDNEPEKNLKTIPPTSTPHPPEIPSPNQ